jgi:hypothetical protein
MRFKKRGGLYFWSVLVASIGSFLYNIEVILGYFVATPVPTWVYIITGVLGYLLYVPAEYLILYSRLHLLFTSPRVLHWTLALAMGEYVFVSIPLAVTWVWGLLDPENVIINLAGDRLSQIEVCTYMAVGMILSGVYVLQTVKMWGANPEPHVRKVLVHLFCINAVLVFLDCANVAMLFSDSIGLDNGWIVGPSFNLLQ